MARPVLAVDDARDKQPIAREMTNVNGRWRAAAWMSVTLAAQAALAGGPGAAGVAAQSPEPSPGVAMAPGGELDPTFGSGGIALVDLGASDGAIHGLVAGPDGTAYLLGEARRDDGSRRTFAIARHGTDGVLDSGWGGDGVVHTGFGESLSGGAYAGAVQPDGKAVVAGFSANPDAHHQTFALARYLPDGTPDPEFGAKGRVLRAVWPETGAGPADIAHAVAIDDQGRIVVAGETGSFLHDLALARFLPDGTPDRSFGRRGAVITDLGGDDRANAIALAPDGGILVAGSGWTEGPDEDFAVGRYLEDGSLDPAFGSDGAALVDFRSGDDRAYGIALRPDGRIVLGGTGQLSGGCANPCERYGLALAQLTADGGLDPSFGDGGRTHPDLLTSSGGYALSLFPDGTAALAGHIGNQDLGLMRVDPDGVPIPVFDGIAITIDVQGGADRGWGVAPGPDGSLYLAGDTADAAGAIDGAVVRYLPPGP